MPDSARDHRAAPPPPGARRRQPAGQPSPGSPSRRSPAAGSRPSWAGSSGCCRTARLARPLPAVHAERARPGGVAFNGLCATAPQPSVATPPVLLPLTSVARNLGAPAPARPGRQRDHVRLDRAVLPGPGHDAVGQQPGLVAEPAEGLLDGRGRGRRAGEHHAGRLGRHRVLRRLRADRGARPQPVHVHPGDLAARREHNPYTTIVGRKWQNTPVGLRPGGDLDAPARRLDRRRRGRGSPSGC